MLQKGCPYLEPSNERELLGLLAMSALSPQNGSHPLRWFSVSPFYNNIVHYTVEVKQKYFTLSISTYPEHRSANPLP